MIKYNEKLSYEIEENGYSIYLDGKLWITQYEPYANVFLPKGTYEENCLEQLAELTAPAEEPNNDFGIPNEVYNNAIDAYTEQLIEEGVIS